MEDCADDQWPAIKQAMIQAIESGFPKFYYMSGMMSMQSQFNTFGPDFFRLTQEIMAINARLENQP